MPGNVTVRMIEKNEQLPGGIVKGWWSRQLAEVNQDAGLWLFAAPGTKFAPEYLESAANLFASWPRLGFCAAWLGGAEEPVHIAREPDALGLLLADELPDCCIMRHEAVEAVGGLERNGSFFSDILRDLWLRLMDAGWSGGIIPRPFILRHRPMDYPCAATRAFDTAFDSIRAVRRAHADAIVASAPDVADLLGTLRGDYGQLLEKYRDVYDRYAEASGAHNDLLGKYDEVLGLFKEGDRRYHDLHDKYHDLLRRYHELLDAYRALRKHADGLEENVGRPATGRPAG
jgi:hypothetical protein